MEKANGSPNGKHHEMTLVTPTIAAEESGFSLNTLRRWRRKGLISAMRTHGGHFRYYLEEVLAFRDDPEGSAFAGVPTARDARKFMIEANTKPANDRGRPEQMQFRCSHRFKKLAHAMKGHLGGISIADVMEKALDLLAATNGYSQPVNTKDSSEIASTGSIEALARAIVTEIAANTALRNHANTPERSDAKELRNAIERLIDAMDRENGKP